MDYPDQIIFAADLTTTAVTIKNARGAFAANGYVQTLIHLGDLLLLHDTVLFRAEWWNLRLLYSQFLTSELEPLMKDGRIKFYASTGELSCDQYVLKGNDAGSREDYISDLSDWLNKQYFEVTTHNKVKDVVRQVEMYSVPNQAVNQSVWKPFYDTVMNVFHEHKMLKEAINNGRHQAVYDHQIGLENALGRIVDIWSTGFYPVYFDRELMFLLKLLDSDTTKTANEYNTSAFPTQDLKLLDDLQSIKNLPSVWQLLWTETWDREKLFKVVNSDQAAYLREWLRKNATLGMDLRDSYYSALETLPSKRNWTNWLRFATQTVLSMGIGFALSGNPILATALGTAAGAADIAWGEKLTSKLLDPYHPKAWLEYIQREVPENTSGSKDTSVERA